MAKVFTVSDGKLVLTLRPAGKGWYAVSSPDDPRLHTQAKSLEEAFVMARDALKLIRGDDRERAASLGPSRPSQPRKTATNRGAASGRARKPAAS